MTVPALKSDEDRLVEIEGEETAHAFMRTLEELVYAKSLSEACRVEGCLPERTFHRVKTRSKEAWQLYTRARASRADHRFDNLIERVEGIECPQKAMVMFKAETWTIGKMNRGLYGDDPVTIQGANGGPIQMHVEHKITGALEEIKKRLARKRKALEGGVLQEEKEGRGVEGAPPSLIPASHTSESKPISGIAEPIEMDLRKT